LGAGTCARALAEAAAVIVTWSCAADGGDASAGLPSRAGPSIDLGAFLGAANRSLSIPAELAPPPGDYICNVSAVRALDGAEARLQLAARVSAGRTPTLYVAHNLLPGGRLPEGARLAVAASVAAGNGTVVSLGWSLVELRAPPPSTSPRNGSDCEGVASPAVDAVLASAFRRTAAGAPSLVLSPCALPTGGEYALTLMAIDSNGGVTYARLRVRTNAPPHGGALTLVGAASPLSAVEVLRGAQLEMVGWDADVDDLPLRFALALRALGDSEYMAVGERSPSTRLASPPLPPGSEWEALGEAVGQWGASSSSSLALAIAPMEGGAAGFVRASLSGGGAFKLAATGGDFIGAWAIAGVIARALLLARALDGSSGANGGALASTNSTEIPPPLGSCPDAWSAEAAALCVLREEAIAQLLAVVEAAVVYATEPPSVRTAQAAGHALVALVSQPTELTTAAVVAVTRAARALAAATSSLVRADGGAGAPVLLLLKVSSSVVSMIGAEVDAEAESGQGERRRLSETTAGALGDAVAVIDSIASGALVGQLSGERAVVHETPHVALAVAIARDAQGDGSADAVAANSEGENEGDCVLRLSLLATVSADAPLDAGAILGAAALGAAGVSVEVVGVLFRRSLTELLAGTSAGSGSINSPVLSLSLRAAGGVTLANVRAAPGAPPVATFVLPLLLADAAAALPPTCAYWDEVAGTWDDEGVRTLPAEPNATGSGQVLQCTSLHLTDFAARQPVTAADGDHARAEMIVEANKVDATLVRSVLVAGPRLTLPWLLVGFISGGWLLALAATWWRARTRDSAESRLSDYRKHHRRRATELAHGGFLARMGRLVHAQHSALRSFATGSRLPPGALGNEGPEVPSLDAARSLTLLFLVISFKLFAAAL
jgi:hypothetical protein